MTAANRESGIGNRKRPRRPRKPRHPDSAEEARLRGLRLLTIRARGRAELTRSLEEKGFTPDAAKQAASRLEREGWLDDGAAARAFVRGRAGRFGRARIQRELSARGFSAQTAAAALADLDGEAEEKALSRLFARIQRATAGLDPERRRRRIWNALARRGFPAADISAKMKRAGQAPPAAPGGEQDRDDVG